MHGMSVPSIDLDIFKQAAEILQQLDVNESPDLDPLAVVVQILEPYCNRKDDNSIIPDIFLQAAIRIHKRYEDPHTLRHVIGNICGTLRQAERFAGKRRQLAYSFLIGIGGK